jgi:hypothetical protein
MDAVVRPFLASFPLFALNPKPLPALTKNHLRIFQGRLASTETLNFRDFFWSRLWSTDPLRGSPDFLTALQMDRAGFAGWFRLSAPESSTAVCKLHRPRARNSAARRSTRCLQLASGYIGDPGANAGIDLGCLGLPGVIACRGAERHWGSVSFVSDLEKDPVRRVGVAS